MKYFLFSIILFLSALAAHGQLNHYYGNLHAHTGYSDGDMDNLLGASSPGQGFTFAKQSYHFDFLGISEHNHYQAGMQHKSFYHAGLLQADTANANGTFVALFGMEWGVIANGGHVLVYGSEKLIGWDTVAGVPDFDTYCPKYDYDSLWKILHKNTNIVAMLAHPSNSDYTGLVGTPHNQLYDSVIVGSAIRSGSAFSTTTDYTDAPATLYESYFRNALARGYRVAPNLDHDNHNTTFGRTAQTRTVILASALHRDTLMSALRQMHFYASDDWNAQLSFTANGNIMGSEIQTAGTTASIGIALADADVGDNVAQIQLYSGVAGSGTNATVLTSNTNQATLNYTAALTLGQTRYYYAKVIQADGDIIWSAPIWVTRNVSLGVTLLGFSAKATEDGNLISWQVANEVNMSGYVVEQSTDCVNFAMIGDISSANAVSRQYTFLDREAGGGVSYYRLKMEEQNGSFSYSAIVAVRQKTLNAFTLLGIHPNPASSFLNISYACSAPMPATMNVYDMQGRLVLQSAATLKSGRQVLGIGVSGLVNGWYYLTLATQDYRLLDTRFLKY